MNEPQHTENTEKSGDKTVIGSYVDAEFPAFQGQSLHGKVDTGATMSCIDAQDIKMDPSGRTVSFVSKSLSPRHRITMDLKSQQDIASADGGVKRRPVIALDVVINGKKIHDALFNLNDRSDMDAPLLIGQNVLQQGDFMVNPKDNSDATPEEQKDNEEVQATSDEVAKDIDAHRNSPVPEEKIHEALKVLQESDITLKDLVRYLRTQIINEIE